MNVEHALDVARQSAKLAGEILLSYYRSRFDVREKEEDNPVTTADLKANQVLADTLLGAFPEAGWLSEESVDDPKRLEKEWIWVVDPLDGTKEFIQGIDEFAVSIGLVHRREAVLGVVYNPAAGHLVSACRGHGAFCNNERVKVREGRPLKGALVLASRSETARGKFDPFQNLLTVQPTGSVANKLGQVARGEADMTFSLVPKNEWDICGGVVVAEEAGARVTDLSGNPFRFNQPDTLRNGLIGTNPGLYPEVLTLIRQQG